MSESPALDFTISKTDLLARAEQWMNDRDALIAGIEEEIVALTAQHDKLEARVLELRRKLAVLKGEATLPLQPFPNPGGEARGEAGPGKPGMCRSRLSKAEGKERAERLKELMAQGLDADEIASMWRTSRANVYRYASRAGLSFKSRPVKAVVGGIRVEADKPEEIIELAREMAKGAASEKQECESDAFRRLEPEKPKQPELSFGDLVYFRVGLGPFVRSTLVALPDSQGEFVVKDHAGKNWRLLLRDKIAPFRERTPTFRVDPTPKIAREIAQEQAPPVVKQPTTGPQTFHGPDAKQVLLPSGMLFEYDPTVPRAQIHELREEARKRQRATGVGPSARVEFLTGVDAGPDGKPHVHVAMVDSMGYGITIKDGTGHVHTVLKWELGGASGGHGERHGLTLTPIAKR